MSKDPIKRAIALLDDYHWREVIASLKNAESANEEPKSANDGVAQQTVEPDAFSIDHSTGTPILMHNNCSVIEGELAYSILNLISRFQWQPIETVPKDGTKVLVGCFKPGAEKYGLVEVDWYSTGGSSRFSFIGFGRFNHIYYPATHWMPLPPVPEEGKAESQKPTPAQAYYMMPCAQLLAQAQDSSRYVGTGEDDGEPD